MPIINSEVIRHGDRSRSDGKFKAAGRRLFGRVRVRGLALGVIENDAVLGVLFALIGRFVLGDELAGL